MTFNSWLCVALIAVLALWRIDAVDSSRELEALRADGLQTQLVESALRVTEQSKVIQAQTTAMADASQASRLFQSLTQTIQRDGQATRQTLAEIKANDKAVADYLLLPVPAAYGVQFSRPATYDPSAYRHTRAMPIGGVPTASAPASAGQQPVGTRAADR